MRKLIPHLNCCSADRRGLSLIETMVGLAVGLLVAATATTLAGNQLADFSQLRAEIKLNQDLRTAHQQILREIMKAGTITADTFQGIAPSADTAGFATPPTAPVTGTLDSPGTEGPVGIFYYTSADQGMWVHFGLRNGAILRASSWWQLSLSVPAAPANPMGGALPMTDSTAMSVQRFVISSSTSTNTRSTAQCLSVCADGTTSCWPRPMITTVRVEITASSPRYPTMVRTASSTVQTRGDTRTGACP